MVTAPSLMATGKAFRHGLEQRLWHWMCERLPTRERSWVVMLSGGPDSLALAEALNHIRNLAKPVQTWVFHVHHGGDHPARQEAWQRCFEWSAQKGWKFHGVKAHQMLTSEAQMRLFRYRAVRQWLKDQGLVAWVFVAHTADDVLETRLIRLIRGVGALGLEAIKALNDPWVRPFLNESRKNVTEYLELLGVSAWQDPSNQDRGYLRNWIRLEWLPLLEARYPGASQRLAQSLENIVQVLKPAPFLGQAWQRGFRIPWQLWAQLPVGDRYHQIALVYYQLQVLNYGVSHIRQVHDYLWQPGVLHPHRVGGVYWWVQDGWIMAQLKL